MEVYKNNPYIDSLKLARFSSAPVQYIKHYLKRQALCRNDYGTFSPSLHPIGHAVDIIAEMLGASLGEKNVQIFLTEEEEEQAKTILSRYQNAVAMHITPNWTANKSWPMSNWIELVESTPKVTFMQFGLAKEPLIPGAVDLRGKVSLREAFAIIKYCRGFVGVESVFAHAAAAFGVPGVVLFGPSSPAVWGHRNNINLYKNLQCSPCTDILKQCACPYEKPCMTSISVSEVSEALKNQMSFDGKSKLYSMKIT